MCLTGSGCVGAPCVPTLALTSWLYLFYSCDEGSNASSQSCADTAYGALDGLLYSHGELDSDSFSLSGLLEVCPPPPYESLLVCRYIQLRLYIPLAL